MAEMTVPASPANSIGPALGSMNGRSTIKFNAPHQRLSIERQDLDQLWQPGPSGQVTLHFAFRIEALRAEGGSFLFDKGGTDGNGRGWTCKLDGLNEPAPGQLSFQHRNTDNTSTYFILVQGASFPANSVLAGSITWDGDISQRNVTVRLLDPLTNTFVTLTHGSGLFVIVASGTIGDDTGPLVVGNTAGSFDGPLVGDVLAYWITPDDDTSQDDSYIRQWVPA